jgi:hypothetical protein
MAPRISCGYPLRYPHRLWKNPHSPRTILQTGLHPVVSEEDEYFVTVTDNEAGGIALTQREV